MKRPFPPWSMARAISAIWWLCAQRSCASKRPRQAAWPSSARAIPGTQASKAGRLGEPLPERSAFDAEGQPTRDPAKALQGAIAAWGGHKGSGLAVVVQMLGMLCNVAPMPQGMFGYGCLFVMMKPDLLMPAAEYEANVAEYARLIRSTRPVPGGAPVRMSFDGCQ
jgi:delta1-piperideine-2-carboxylate reductase